MKLESTAVLVIAGSPLVAAGLAAILSPYSTWFSGWPLFGLCLLFIFALQWLLFIPAWLLQTESFFDLSGSATYICVVVMALALADAPDLRSLLLAALIIAWAVRLGSFLFLRVRKAGHDSRFVTIVPNFRVHLMTWTLQGLWVSLTASAALAALTSLSRVQLDAWALVGTLLWLSGFVIEVVADRQKQAFRRNPDNALKFITTGLWAWSRHPNYFGEILLWTGIAVIAVPALAGWQYLTLLSPVFVLFLMTRVSGVDMLERQGQKRWGREPAYQQYLARTSVLVPLPPRITRPAGETPA